MARCLNPCCNGIKIEQSCLLDFRKTVHLFYLFYVALYQQLMRFSFSFFANACYFQRQMRAFWKADFCNRLNHRTFLFGNFSQMIPLFSISWTLAKKKTFFVVAKVQAFWNFSSFSKIIQHPILPEFRQIPQNEAIAKIPFFANVFANCFFQNVKERMCVSLAFRLDRVPRLIESGFLV